MLKGIGADNLTDAVIRIKLTQNLNSYETQWVASKVYMNPSGLIHFARDPLRFIAQ